MIRGRTTAVLAIAALLAGCAGGGETASEADTSPAPDVAADTTTDPAAPDDDGEAAPDDGEAAGAADAADDHDDTATDDHEDEDGAADAADDHDDAADDDHEDGTPAEAHGDDEVDRVVLVEMQDVKFSVEELTVAPGERVRFEFVNVGAAPHEAVLGDMHVQDEHEAMMADGGHHDGGHHDATPVVSLEPGESGAFVHEFSEPGELWLGCHVPGHWGAGMRTRLVVTG